jgi:hypothetical protein
MATNPLQQYFRQPKIYVGLPSKGAYNKPGSLQGDVENMPVYGMNGMDEILLKTPDALISGESTVKVIESCCPAIKDAWDVSTIDTNILFAAIRIATFGNTLSVTHICPSCTTEHDYDLDLNAFVEFYTNCVYKNKVAINDLVVKTQPLSYKQATDLNIKTFNLQQKLNQALQLSEEEQKVLLKELFDELSLTQNELYMQSVESVEVGNTVVTDQEHIQEWLQNCDKKDLDKIKAHIEENRTAWRMPGYKVKCDKCQAENTVEVDLDQSNFFEEA